MRSMMAAADRQLVPMVMPTQRLHLLRPRPLPCRHLRHPGLQVRAPMTAAPKYRTSTRDCSSYKTFSKQRKQERRFRS